MAFFKSLKKLFGTSVKVAEVKTAEFKEKNIDKVETAKEMAKDAIEKLDEKAASVVDKLEVKLRSTIEGPADQEAAPEAAPEAEIREPEPPKP